MAPRTGSARAAASSQRNATRSSRPRVRTRAPGGQDRLRAAVDPEPPATERVREQGEDGAVAAPEVEDEVLGRDAGEAGRREHPVGRGRVHQRKVGLQLPEARVVHHPCVDSPVPSILGDRPLPSPANRRCTFGFRRSWALGYRRRHPSRSPARREPAGRNECCRWMAAVEAGFANNMVGEGSSRSCSRTSEFCGIRALPSTSIGSISPPGSRSGLFFGCTTGRRMPQVPPRTPFYRRMPFTPPGEGDGRDPGGVLEPDTGGCTRPPRLVGGRTR